MGDNVTGSDDLSLDIADKSIDFGNNNQPVLPVTLRDLNIIDESPIFGSVDYRDPVMKIIFEEDAEDDENTYNRFSDTPGSIIHRYCGDNTTDMRRYKKRFGHGGQIKRRIPHTTELTTAPSKKRRKKKSKDKNKDKEGDNSNDTESVDKQKKIKKKKTSTDSSISGSQTPRFETNSSPLASTTSSQMYSNLDLTLFSETNSLLNVFGIDSIISAATEKSVGNSKFSSPSNSISECSTNSCSPGHNINNANVNQFENSALGLSGEEEDVLLISQQEKNQIVKKNDSVSNPDFNKDTFLTMNDIGCRLYTPPSRSNKEKIHINNSIDNNTSYTSEDHTQNLEQGKAHKLASPTSQSPNEVLKEAGQMDEHEKNMKATNRNTFWFIAVFQKSCGPCMHFFKRAFLGSTSSKAEFQPSKHPHEEPNAALSSVASPTAFSPDTLESPSMLHRHQNTILNSNGTPPNANVYGKHMFEKKMKDSEDGALSPSSIQFLHSKQNINKKTISNLLLVNGGVSSSNNSPSATRFPSTSTPGSVPSSGASPLPYLSNISSSSVANSPVRIRATTAFTNNPTVQISSHASQPEQIHDLQSDSSETPLLLSSVKVTPSNLQDSIEASPPFIKNMSTLCTSSAPKFTRHQQQQLQITFPIALPPPTQRSTNSYHKPYAPLLTRVLPPTQAQQDISSSPSSSIQSASPLAPPLHNNLDAPCFLLPVPQVPPIFTSHIDGSPVSTPTIYSPQLTSDEQITLFKDAMQVVTSELEQFHGSSSNHQLNDVDLFVGRPSQQKTLGKIR